MMEYELELDNLSWMIEDIATKFGDGVIILRGDLASGKTTFVKEFVKFLGLADEVTSPTFSLQQCYSNRVFHYDIYNHGFEHFVSLGMLEELEKDGVHLVEWGDEKLIKILDSAGMKILIVDIDKQNNQQRKYKVDYAYA